jgi:hypothetical protein
MNFKQTIICDLALYWLRMRAMTLVLYLRFFMIANCEFSYCSTEMEGLEPVPEDVVNYVFRILRHGIPFKAISVSIGITDPRQLKRMMTNRLGYEFQLYPSLTVDEVRDQIELNLPIHGNGSNWRIRQVKVALARLDIRVPRPKVAAALLLISGLHDYETLCKFDDIYDLPIMLFKNDS